MSDRPARRAPASLRLGDLLVAEGLVTRAQVDEALRVQKTSERYSPLGRILIDQKILTREQLVSLLDRHRRGVRLGNLLVKSGAINHAQLASALAEQRRTARPLGELLIELKYIDEPSLRQAICRQLHIRFFALDAVIVEPSLRTLVNEKFAMKHRVVPVTRTGDTLVVAMDDPTQSQVIDTLQRSTDLHIEVTTSTSAAISRALTRLYREEVRPRLSRGENVDLRIPTPPSVGQVESAAHSETADEIVRKLLRVAIDRGASDIHLETIDHRLQVRFRIDGNLQSFNLGGLVDDLGRQRAEVISRIKILSNLDIAERRRPQDGSFRGRVQGDGRVFPMDFRVSIIPGYHGENAVIRILDPRTAPESVEGLGLSPAVTAGLRRLSRAAAGMLLVTGPTGSGKSTTLFGILKSISRPEIKIITAEDPIEYVCEDFCQHEVNDRAGNTFARFVRSFLRHDPEVIMIGEIRDSETAELAFRAAQTGHLVLSTLHTNDALSAITRLKDLGIDHGRCVSSLLGVVAQRLIRTICWNCKQAYAPPVALLRELFDEVPASLTWYRGGGCVACHHTGYKGRLAIAELWELSEDDVMCIGSGGSMDEIRRSAAKSTIPMTDDVVTALREGRINLEDLVRALPQKTMRELRTLPL